MGGRQPPRAAAARFALARITSIFMHYRRKKKLFSCFFIYYSRARAVVATGRVAKVAISQGCHPRRFILLYIYIYRCHRYLHAKFQ